MKQPYQVYELEEPNYDADYKEQAIYDRDKNNYESPNKWLYLGADIRNLRYAKVGITMGDLTKRSYSSANPNYYLYCAFKCQNCIERKQLEEVEQAAMAYLDFRFCWNDGTTKRVRHYESSVLSECYFDIDFRDFFEDLHSYLLMNHERNFQIIGTENNDGRHLNCMFNRHIPAWQQEDLKKDLIHYYY